MDCVLSSLLTGGLSGQEAPIPSYSCFWTGIALVHVLIKEANLPKPHPPVHQLTPPVTSADGWEYWLTGAVPSREQVLKAVMDWPSWDNADGQLTKHLGKGPGWMWGPLPGVEESASKDPGEATPLCLIRCCYRSHKFCLPLHP